MAWCLPPNAYIPYIHFLFVPGDCCITLGGGHACQDEPFSHSDSGCSIAQDHDLFFFGDVFRVGPVRDDLICKGAAV